MITFRFDQRKATQVASRFLVHEGGRMNYMKLIKLVYLADREALRVRCSPIVGDRYVSMKHGPVVSSMLDLIKDNHVEAEYWNASIRRCADEPYSVELTGNPIADALSRRELKIVDELSDKFRAFQEWDMVDWCHKNCREWQNPEEIVWPSMAKKVIDIQVEEIFEGLEMNLSAEELRAIEQESEFENAASCLLG